MNLSLLNDNELAEALISLTGNERAVTLSILHHLNEISLIVTEYQAEVVQDQQGNQYIAIFPEGVSRPTQYGNDTKASSVCLSQYQLVPLERIKDYFQDQTGIGISKGSIANFNVEASAALDDL